MADHSSRRRSSRLALNGATTDGNPSVRCTLIGHWLVAHQHQAHCRVCHTLSYTQPPTEYRSAPHTGLDNSKRARRAHGDARPWRLPGVGRRWSCAPLSGKHLPWGDTPMAIMGSASPSPVAAPLSVLTFPKGNGPRYTRTPITHGSVAVIITALCPVGRLALMLICTLQHPMFGH